MTKTQELARRLADSHGGYIRVLDLQYECKIAGDLDPMEVFREMVKYEASLVNIN